MNYPQVSGYEIIEKIGAGGYSTVYKAYKKGNPKDVYAVKCIDKQFHKKSFTDNIVKEISFMKHLKHPNIVDLKDFTWNAGHVFIITEYCDGGDLSRLIRSRHKLRESVVKKLMQQLANALKYLRDNKICHMDLKPQNLLIIRKPELTLKVADFGLAQHNLTGDNEQFRFMGSPLYMAPEKLQHLQFDSRVDLWSCGVIMYECLFGRPPYTNLTSHTLTLMAKGVPIELPKHTNISPECEDLLKRLLKHNLEERINFDEFFNHPFLKQEEPLEEMYQEALKNVETAIKFDQEEKFSESLPLYERTVQLLRSLLESAEIDAERKTAIKLRLTEYTERIVNIKDTVKNKGEQCTIAESHAFTKDDFDNLIALSRPTAELATALEIGKIGELYLLEGQKNLALEKLKSALCILVPALQNEPMGNRRKLLHQQVQIWLKIAENIG